MGEFIFELLLAILEPILDALLELIASAVMDLVSRILSDAFDTLDSAAPVVATLVYSLLGMLAGACSLLAFPHHLVHPSRIPGISLLVSPFLTGAVLSIIGTFLRSRDKTTTRIESFRYGFAFALGMSVVRLLFAH